MAILRSDGNRAYVVFRGTDLWDNGTWLLTNFQAASTPFYVVDEKVKADELGPKLQGATLKRIGDGVVHQGFLRSWSQLWYGTDIVASTFLGLGSPWRMFVRYFFIAVFFGSLAHYGSTTAWFQAHIGRVNDWFSFLIGLLFKPTGKFFIADERRTKRN